MAKKANAAPATAAAAIEKERERVLAALKGKKRSEVAPVAGTLVFELPEGATEPVVVDYRPDW